MKTKLFIIWLIVSVVMVGCNHDILELKPLDEYSDAAVWSDLHLAEAVLNGCYKYRDDPFNKFSIGNLVDELERRDGVAQTRFNNCQITPDVIPGWSWLPTWDNEYKAIRAVNIFLEKATSLPDGEEVDGVTMKNRMLGEAYFLRAHYYRNLVNLFGGVPIIKESYDLESEFQVPRNSYEDCVEFIVEDCEKAADLLPLEHSGDNMGRATKGAALALKSRVLLYAASDLYNTTVFPGYANPELIGYVGGDREARWRRAKTAAKDVMDLNIYSLYKANPEPGDSIAANFEEYFLKRESTEEDILMEYRTTTSYRDANRSWQNLSGPNGYHLRGSNAPLDNLVRDYEMRDGTKFDWNNPEHAAHPYKNRDPRFYATIFYEGARWRQRASGEYPLDPVGQIQVGRWEKWDPVANEMYEHWGLDTRKGPYSPFEGAYTGYYIRKWMDSEVDAQFFIPDISYRWIRYAEILLNYAEACIELGEDAEARIYINMIRKRAGMPDITESGDELRERYRNERRIELAVERHRFFDVRRWVIGPEVYTASYRVDVVYKLLPDKTTATEPTVTPVLHKDYSWDNKAYFLPVMRSEMNKNSELIQNPGYE
ncbi:RagB/SusD family nutrient uptake outer membrane protein [Mariniphaga sediminis]|uniref:RagB/SusD family nutrient uptake outer membrane protein n=1 Tax=Mariniphaga sediminis TaxID=1628158 RepID=UPI0035636386